MILLWMIYIRYSKKEKGRYTILQKYTNL